VKQPLQKDGQVHPTSEINIDKSCSDMHLVVSKDKALPKQTVPGTKYVS